MTVTGELETPVLRVRELLTEHWGLKLALAAGKAGLDGIVTSARIQKPGLALLGAADYVHEGRVQVLGKSELRFARELPAERLAEVSAALVARRPACMLLTRGGDPPPPLRAAAEAAGIPLLVSGLISSMLIDRLTHFLEDRLAPRMQGHGVLMDIYGLGVLLRGASGIGKSEAALDLVVRGHRLVADDVVRIRRVGNNVLIGSGPEILRHHMELRGLGIINIKDLFGVAAVRDEKAIDVVVDLVRWDESEVRERLGLDDRHTALLGVDLPFVEMQVAAGRSVAILIEVAARNHILAVRGYHAGRELVRKIERRRAMTERTQRMKE